MAAKTGPLVVIVGQTASGKSALAMELARLFNGELICADARTVYQGMDIGTAKPTKQEQALVPHHLLDVATPEERFTAADFKSQATAAIEDITNKGKLPIMVGGTGLYVDAVLYDFQFRKAADPALRAELEQMSVEELQQKISSLGLPLPANERNPRHLIRVIETKGEVGSRGPLRANTLVIGIELDKDLLRARVRARVDAMVEAGFIEEVKALRQEYGEDSSAFDTPGYRPFLAYMKGELNLDEAKEQFVKNDLNLAKRQKTWFKRNKSIHWISQPVDAVAVVTTFMNKSTQ